MIAISKKLLQKLPLQTAIIIPFAIQIAIAVGAVAYLSYRNGQEAVYSMATQLQQELTVRILQAIEDTVAKPHIINQLNANSLLQGDINLLTGQGEHLFWQQMKIFPATNFVYCATEADGAFMGVGRSQGGTGRILQIQEVNLSTNRYFHYYDISPIGRREALSIIGDKPYDPRLRPWYEATKLKGEATWSKVYLDFETRLPTITANLPVFQTDTGELFGICATDIILSEELNDFLRNLKISQSGIAFIVDPSGSMIASSTPEPILAKQGEDSILLYARDSENPVIRQTFEHLEKQLFPIESGASNHVIVPIDKDNYLVQASHFSDGLGLDWILVLAIPENDFMGPIDDQNKTTLALYLLALILTGVSGLVMAKWLIKPLRELSIRANEIAKGKWDRPIEIERSDAIGDLSRSFAAMAQQLKELFTTLEQRVEERNQELLQLNQELQRLAHVDGLTQVANRRYFDSFLDQAWQQLARDQQPLSLLLCDVDYFKAYNDTYGHQAGDRCLQQLAALFMQVVHRPADLVARYGGEEFALVLAHTDRAGAAHIARQICDAVEALHLPHRDAPLGRVSVSLGLATAIPIPGQRHQDLVAAADQALYLAKNGGRNTYRSAQPLTTLPMDR